MAENNNDFDDLSEIDALLDEVSREELDPDLSGFDDVVQTEADADSPAAVPSNDAPLGNPRADERENANQAPRDLANVAAAAAGVAAGAAMAGSVTSRERNERYDAEPAQEPALGSRSAFDQFDQFTGRDEMDFQSNQSATTQVALTRAQEASLKKTKMTWLLLSITTLVLALGALVMSSLAWMNSGSPALTGAVQVQYESMEQQRVLLQSINQQLGQLEQKVDVTRLMLDDVIAGQAVNPQQVQRQVVAETPIAAAPANVSTPVNAVAQGNSQELQRRIEQVQRTANTIQSRLGQLNDQMEQLNQQQQRTTQVVRELEKSWLEQILATNEPEQPTAEDSPGIAPDAYRYVAPTNQFSFP